VSIIGGTKYRLELTPNAELGRLQQLRRRSTIRQLAHRSLHRHHGEDLVGLFAEGGQPALRQQAVPAFEQRDSITSPPSSVKFKSS
jgi:hypothetical protein